MSEDREFTDEQMHAALRAMGENARRDAFAVGRPVMVVRDGKLVLIYADGREEVVEEQPVFDSSQPAS